MKSAIRIATCSILSIICSLNGFSQKVPANGYVVIDFLKMSAKPTYTKVDHGTECRIKIENINLSLYKIEGTSSQVNYNTEMPDIFKGIKLPGYLNLALPPNPVPAGPGGASLPRRAVAREMDPISQNLAIIDNAIKKINATAELNNEFRNLYTSCSKTYSSISQDKITAVNTFLNTNTSHEPTQETNLENSLEGFINNAIAAKSVLDILVPQHLNTIKTRIKLNKNNIIDPWIKKELPEAHPLYQQSFNLYRAAVDENEVYTAYNDSLKALFIKAAESVTELKKFRDDNKINELLSNYRMINEANFTYYSDLEKAKSDVVKFDIKITAEKPLPCNVPTKVGINETYRTVGGWKMDFSTGVFVNGGGKDFLGRELLYQAINDSTVQIRSKDGGKRLLLSVGALMHIYYRSGGLVNYAISPGLSTTTAFDGINFHLGGSVIFGGENRLVITGGLTLREAKILDREYEYDKSYAKKLMPDSPPTIKVFPKAGWFFGLTYNWSKLKK